MWLFLTNGIWASEAYAIYEQKLQMWLPLVLSLCHKNEHLPRRGYTSIWDHWMKGHAEQRWAGLQQSHLSTDTGMWVGNKCWLLQATEILDCLLYSKPTNAGCETLFEFPLQFHSKQIIHIQILICSFKKQLFWLQNSKKILAYITNKMKCTFPY